MWPGWLFGKRAAAAFSAIRTVYRKSCGIRLFG